MTFVITQPCIDVQDKSCVEVCPVDCIHFEEGADRMLYIDPVECIDCGACQPACPVSAIFPEADVPADQQPFIEINTLWYQDRAAARAKVPGGDGAAAAPAASESPASAEAPAAEEPAKPAAGADPAESPAAAETTAETPAAETAAEEAPAAAAEQPVAAAAEPTPEEPAARYRQVPVGMAAPAARVERSPLSVAAIGLFALAFFVMWQFPGPTWIEVGGVGIGASVLILAPVAVVLALMFVGAQAADLSRYAASHERDLRPWRLVATEWRRSEESRRHVLAQTVADIAEARFAYPNDEHPELTTHVNLPEPRMALELSGGEKLFPDIVVTRNPGNFPAMVAQVETAETLTREQVRYVWKRFENESAPLYVYVPAGMASRARDYMKDAGIKHARLRTWRHTPRGIVVKEL